MAYVNAGRAQTHMADFLGQMGEYVAASSMVGLARDFVRKSVESYDYSVGNQADIGRLFEATHTFVTGKSFADPSRKIDRFDRVFAGVEIFAAVPVVGKPIKLAAQYGKQALRAALPTARQVYAVVAAKTGNIASIRPFAPIVGVGERFADSAVKAGLKSTDEIGDIVKDLKKIDYPCGASLYRKPRTVIGFLLSLVESTAYAAGPCDKVTRALNDSTQSAANFEKSLSNLSTSERIAKIRGVARVKAGKYKWKKNGTLNKKNPGREIYSGKDGKHWSVDTYHGRFEKFDKNGKHLGEFDIDLKPLPNSVVPGRTINI